MEQGTDSRKCKTSDSLTYLRGFASRSLPSPLSLDGWLEFNRMKWGLKPLKLRLAEEGKQLPVVEACLYLDRRGRIRQPPRNPYLPVSFFPTPTVQRQKIYRQWLALSELLAGELYQRGLGGLICFPPEIVDVREFQWKGYLAEPRYTFLLNLPYDMNNADHAVRKQIAKATRMGYRCEQTRSFDDVYLCLRETERRQSFNYGLNPADFRLASELLGDEVFRCYTCYASNGEVASARIVLRHPDGHVLDWVAGAMGKHLTNGVTQLLISFVLDDLGKSGALSFDYCGANIRTVAASKATWGGQLQPYYAITAPNLRGLARFVWHQMRKYRRWLQW